MTKDATTSDAPRRSLGHWPPIGALTTSNAALLAPGIVACAACVLLGVAGWLGLAALEQAGTPATQLQARIAVVAVAVLAGVASFLAWRFALGRLSTHLAIAGAARAAADGASLSDELEVTPATSIDARAWNSLVPKLLANTAVADQHATTLASAIRTDETTQACDALWVGLAVIDAAGTVVYANGACAILLGLRTDSLRGSAIKDAFDTDTAFAIEAALAGRGPKRTELHIERDLGQGTTATLRVNLRAFSGSAGHSAVLTIEDATRQLAAEKARTAFVEQAAHELRTPLTNIQLYIEELIDLPDDEVSARTRAINIINQESTRLDRIVGDMLSVSEIEAGAMSLGLGDVRLEPLMNDLKQEFAPQATDKSISLNFDLPPKYPLLRADRDKLVIILHNVIGNALKYTPAGGTVTLSLAEEAGSLVFTVADSGIGIPADQMDKVFERFYRVKDERTTEVVGTGLGLPLAREFARMHGGDITLESIINAGSTFTVSVPTRASSTSSAAAA